MFYKFTYQHHFSSSIIKRSRIRNSWKCSYYGEAQCYSDWFFFYYFFFCNSAGLKEMKIVEIYFYWVGLEGNNEAGSMKKKRCHLYSHFSNHKYTSICIYFLVKTAAEINLNHTHALSEFIFMILWVQISNLALEEIWQVSVYWIVQHFKMRNRQCSQLSE